MKLSELVANYDFHDSGIKHIDILNNENKIIMTIQFCNWRQLSYKNGEPEIILGRLTFSGVKKFEYKPFFFKCDDCEIINIKTERVNHENESEIINMMLYDNNDVRVLMIQADVVKWSI